MSAETPRAGAADVAVRWKAKLGMSFPHLSGESCSRGDLVQPEPPPPGTLSGEETSHVVKEVDVRVQLARHASPEPRGRAICLLSNAEQRVSAM
jgi:hypothetical protein